MTQATLYIKEECPYCRAALKLLDDKGVDYVSTSVYDMSSQERAEVAAKTNNYRTVPQIFIGEHHVGGSDELAALERAGKLDALLAG